MATGEYQGYFINLDRSADRRAAMEAQLGRLGIKDRYRRFRAADGNVLHVKNPVLLPGEIGVFTSNALLLSEASQADQHVHVIEDDVVFSPIACDVLDRSIGSGILDEIDVLFTDVAVPVDVHHLSRYKKLFDETIIRDQQNQTFAIAKFAHLDLRNLMFASMSSYLVSRRVVTRLAKLFDHELRSEPSMPVDLYLRKLIYDGQVTATCIFPFITSLDLTVPSTIDGRRGSELSILAANIVRQSFFVGCEAQSIQDILSRHFPDPEQDFHQHLLSRMLHFAAFGDYRAQ